MYTYMLACMHTCNMYMYIYIYKYIHTYIYMYMYEYARQYKYIYIYIYIYMYTYICIYKYMYIYTYKYIYMRLCAYRYPYFFTSSSTTFKPCLPGPASTRAKKGLKRCLCDDKRGHGQSSAYFEIVHECRWTRTWTWIV